MLNRERRRQCFQLVIAGSAVSGVLVFLLTVVFLSCCFVHLWLSATYAVRELNFCHEEAEKVAFWFRRSIQQKRVTFGPPGRHLSSARRQARYSTLTMEPNVEQFSLVTSLPCPPCCIPGERGPPGEPGLPAHHGTSGSEGSLGRPGIALNISCIPERIYEAPPCLPCAQGPRGPPGQPGYPGDLGDQGIPGRPGANRLNGPVGDPGEKGPPGVPGDLGNMGPFGPIGVHGSPGNPGFAGVCICQETEVVIEDSVPHDIGYSSKADQSNQPPIGYSELPSELSSRNGGFPPAMP
ncbi:unnamed protein product [Soboliphyme baturini]|uniref:Col_cuticle_N domain-containing protein n=1 Tax=Soboliphyme baturini TaxID=241478 RepID=A0A183J538_9BILA|nr:unnamed protein product [Soboliphyme baturini]